MIHWTILLNCYKRVEFSRTRPARKSKGANSRTMRARKLKGPRKLSNFTKNGVKNGNKKKGIRYADSNQNNSNTNRLTLTQTDSKNCQDSHWLTTLSGSDQTKPIQIESETHGSTTHTGSDILKQTYRVSQKLTFITIQHRNMRQRILESSCHASYENFSAA